MKKFMCRNNCFLPDNVLSLQTMYLVKINPIGNVIKEVVKSAAICACICKKPKLNTLISTVCL